MDDEIIKKKLLIDGDGIGDDKRINVFLRNFIRWCDQKPTVDDNDKVNYEEENLNYERLIATIGQCDHALNKSTLIQEMNQFEMNYYDDLAEKIQQTIEQTQTKIETLKSDLEDAKIVKKNKLVYDDHVDTIFQHPARQETSKLIEQINNDIQRLNEIKAQLEMNFELKRKQFQQLINSLKELDASLNQDDLNREIQSLMDDEYYDNLKTDKAEPEIVLFKDPSNFISKEDQSLADRSINDLNSSLSSSSDRMDFN